MKILGEVTIFKGDEVISSKNLLVDGAGQTICDMLMVPPGVSAANTYLLDASNYTVQALSFGKDKLAWVSDAHDSNAIGFFYYNRIPTFVATVGASAGTFHNSQPSYPNPEDVYLETSAVVPTISVSSGYTVNKDWMYGGQLVNLPGLWKEVYDASVSPFSPTEVSSYSLSDVSTMALRCGSFVSGNDANNLSAVVVLSGVGPGGAFNAQYILSSANFGYNNSKVRCMDYRGFINFIGVSTPASVANYDKSGLVSVFNTSFSSLLEVEFRHTMDKMDVITASLYNGFNSMGLWTIDNVATQQAQQPPYLFHPVTTKREYRLFSKKTFSKNLGYFRHRVSNLSLGDKTGLNTGVADLTISWKLKFK